MTSVFSWKVTATALEEENEPNRVLLITVAFCDCVLYRTVKLLVGNEILEPGEKE